MSDVRAIYAATSAANENDSVHFHVTGAGLEISLELEQFGAWNGVVLKPRQMRELYCALHAEIVRMIDDQEPY